MGLDRKVGCAADSRFGEGVCHRLEFGCPACVFDSLDFRVSRSKIPC